jgi:hypothetical protein
MKLLRRLGDELDTLGLQGEILLVGGAAMCLVHEARDNTKDIDALYEPKEEINKLAAKIAEQECLPKNWLNDSVKGFIGPNAQREAFMSIRGLRISTVSAEYLLAMKMMASRYGDSDYNDIVFLMKKLAIKTSEEAMEILLSFFNSSYILPKTEYTIYEALNIINCGEHDKIRCSASEKNAEKLTQDKCDLEENN